MQTESVKIPTELMYLVREEAEKRGCFIMRVIEDAIHAYFEARRPRGKKAQ
jgi:hypothetical protein